jgi:hypothetical protein
MTPGKRKAPEGTGADATTYSLTSPNHTTATTTDNATAYGVMLDRPVTTSRTCAGEFCWCHVGATIAWPFDHHQEMARIFREIRTLEIAGGVVGT